MKVLCFLDFPHVSALAPKEEQLDYKYAPWHSRFWVGCVLLRWKTRNRQPEVILVQVEVPMCDSRAF